MENKLKKGIVAAVLLISLTVPYLPVEVTQFLPFKGASLLGFLIMMYVFIMFASAWNLLAYSGQGSLGHAAFLGIGAYASAIILKYLKPEPWLFNSINLEVILTVLAGGLAASIVGVLIGLTCVRLREWFLGMVTFGFAIIISTITTELSGFTGGHDGLPTKHLVTATDFASRYNMEYYIILVFTVAVIYLIHRILKSKLGLAFEAIRENELEARVMGINTVKYKLIGFALSAFFSGIAGALMYHHIGYLTPTVFDVENSFKPIIYCITGGLFTLEGPILGTVIISALWDGLKSLGLMHEHLVIIGLLLIIIVIFLPNGLISLPRRLGRKSDAKV
ncbi:MAG: branched-chain amino acid ABC transporter permease [Candidatus Altiarchaeota archaeon]|nr:branched-chain amino acid ABC transporter permease [Candidatus Altiarchaeota archaeon]